MLHKGLVVHLTTDAVVGPLVLGPINRVFPMVIPQAKRGGAPTVPAVVYDLRAVARLVTYCGTSGLVQSTVTIDCYAVDYDTAKELAAAVRRSLIDFKGLLGGLVDVRYVSLQSEFDVQDIEPGLFRVSQSWLFWHTE